MDGLTDSHRRCAAGNLDPHPGKPPGSRCAEWDGRQPGWAAHGTPLCESEFRISERDTRQIPYDYVDLEDMIPKSMSQALDTQPAGKPGPPIPLAVGVDALQREMVHVLTTWEEEVRRVGNLSPVPIRGQAAPWHTTVSNLSPPARVRPRTAVTRAVGVLAPRLELLARMEPALVFPTGYDDDPREVAGWEAVLAFSRLHQRARSMLGRTRRTAQLPGDCSQCGAADLRRDEPRYGPRYKDDPADPCNVYCGQCPAQWTTAEYERYVEMLVWPVRSAA